MLDILTPTVLGLIIVFLFIWSLYLRKQFIYYYNRFKVSSGNEKKFLEDITRKKSIIQVQKAKIDRLQNDNTNFETLFAGEKSAHNSLKKEYHKNIAELEKNKSFLQDESEHYKEEIKALTEQLKEINLKNKTTSKQNKQHLAKITEQNLKTSKNSETQIKRLNNELSTKEKTIKNLQYSKKETINILLSNKESIENLQRKLKHYQHFYFVVEGQKKMLEERNSNWEKALYQLSTAILKTNNSTTNEVTANLSLGELVAQAFEISNLEPLIKDEYSSPHILQPSPIHSE